MSLEGRIRTRSLNKNSEVTFGELLDPHIHSELPTMRLRLELIISLIPYPVLSFESMLPILRFPRKTVLGALVDDARVRGTGRQVASCFATS